MSYRRGGAPTVMAHSYAHVPDNSVPRSTFVDYVGAKTTMDAGYLVPVKVIEIYPGDTFQVWVDGSARLATPITPYMDNQHFELHAHFCPNRLNWEHWENFMGAREPDPDSTIDYVIPQIVAPASVGAANGTLWDYMGYPTQVANLSASALPFRMYSLMYNQWYRDENLQDSIPHDIDDSASDYTDYVLQRRGKRKDYFTSCLPEPQKGAAVDIPLLGTAPITGIGFNGTATLGTNATVRETNDNSVVYANYAQSTGGNPLILMNGNNASTSQPQIFADLSAASGASINDFRLAVATQQLLEIDMRGGTRYVELLKAHFNVISPDFRLQRVEFLGGISASVVVTPVAQTSETGTTPLANLAAIGTVGFSHRHLFTKSFVEHGILMIIATVRADLNYQQGLNRSWSRRTRYDFYFPTFANLGEQAVLNKEIYAQGPGAVNPSTSVAYDEEVFGYQEPWGDLRMIPSTITGQFRSNYAQTLDIWHLAQYFTALPTLNDEFIVEDPPVDRIKAVEGGEETTYPDYLVDLTFMMKMTRELPLYGKPGLHKL